MSAFYYCKKLKNLTLPQTLTEIGSNAFYGCSGLTALTLPDSVSYIGYNAFSFCSGLTSLTIHGSVGTVDSNAFSNCSNLETVTFSSGTKQIGDSAFYNCKKLKNLTLPDTLTEIGPWAFAGCAALTSITVPDSVAFIGDNAFSSCRGLKTVTLSDSLTAINEYAFSDCASLESIIIPDSVKTIGVCAFACCTSLKSVFIPKSVTTIETFSFYDSPFFDCPSDLVICCEAASKPNGWDDYWNYYSDTGTLTVKFGATVESLFWDSLTGNETSVVVPEGITSIPDYAFANNQTLKKVILPSTVTSIGDSAFSGCSNLESINLPEGLAHLGSSAFVLCEALTSVTIPGSLTTISAYAFESSGLTEIILPEGVTTIEESAFAYCESATKILLPDSLRTIGANAFTNTSAPWIYIPAGVTTIAGDTSGSGAFCSAGYMGATIYCGAEDWPEGWGHYWTEDRGTLLGIGPEEAEFWYSLDKTAATVTIPDYVTFIPSFAFDGNTALKKVIIPESVTDLGNYAFRGCTGLTEVTIPGNPRYVGNYAFWGCSNLETVILEEGISSIGSHAFYGCSGLKSVTIPGTVMNIFSNAFSRCTGLERIFLPDSISSIPTTSAADSPFYGCSADLKIYCGSYSKPYSWGSYWNYYSSTGTLSATFDATEDSWFWDNLDKTQAVIHIPEGVTSIPDYAFRYNGTLTEISIPSTVTSIGEQAFAYCESLTAITVPGSVTAIGTDAFCGCAALSSVTLSEGLQTIGDCAFQYCESLTAITLPQSLTAIGTYAFNSTGLKKIVIPEGVTAIEEQTFSICESLTQVILPETLTSIGDMAFFCSAVPWIYVPESVTTIAGDENGYGAFFGGVGTVYCGAEGPSEGWGSNWNANAPFFYGIAREEAEFWYSLDNTAATVTVPDYVTFIPPHAFYLCGDLKEITIPASVTSIGRNAFLRCTGLTGITLPDSLTDLGGNAFNGCTGLTEVTVPGSVTTMNGSTFAYCSGLETVILEEGITSISTEFSNCTGLTSVTLPSTLTAIGYGAFSKCTALKSIFIPASVTTILAYSYGGPFADCSADLVIYCEAETQPEGWSQYWNLYNSTNALEVHFGAYENYEFWGSLTRNETRIEIPEGITKIPGDRLYEFVNLEEVIIPSTVTSIDSLVFSGCPALKWVYIPESVTTIGSCAFESCPSLKWIYIPESVTTMGERVFYGSHPDLTIFCGAASQPEGWSRYWANYSNYNSYTPYWGFTETDARFWGTLDKTQAVITIPEGVTVIPDHAFDGYATLKQINIPSSVTSIGTHAFAGTGLTSITIPAGVTDIQDYLFSGCVMLTEVILPDSVTTIHQSAFAGCSMLERIDLPGSLENIHKEAFFACASLKWILIPESVTYIEAGSVAYSPFHDCSEDLVIYCEAASRPDGWNEYWNHYSSYQSYVTHWGYTADDAAFWGSVDTTQTSITIPDGVTVIPDNAFYECTGLTQITIPEGVTSIGDWAFRGCTGLTEVRLPASLQSIGDSAFYLCENLKTVTFSEGLLSIGDSAFYDCKSLTEITFPEGLQTIGSSAFYDCAGLRKIIIPASVTSIGMSAFYGCDALRDITFGHTDEDPLQIESDAFLPWFAGVATTVRVPYAPRQIHSVIYTNLQEYSLRDVTWAATETVAIEKLFLSAENDIRQEEVGLPITLLANVGPDYATGKLIWEVSDPVIGTVIPSENDTAQFIGKAAGTVTVTCTAENSNASARLELTVLPPTGTLTGLSIRSTGPSPSEIPMGTPTRMEVVFQPANAAQRDVIWELENGSGRATIDENGVITPIEAGTVLVTAVSAADPSILDVRTITIVSYVRSIAIRLGGHSNLDKIGVGETVTLSAQILAGDADCQIQWSLENKTGFAVLNPDGPYLEAVEAGTVVLTATAADSMGHSVSLELNIVGTEGIYPLSNGSGNLYYNTVTGVITGSDSTVTDVVIPAKIGDTTITSIGPYAFARRYFYSDNSFYFQDNNTLSSVRIPDTVTFIGESAFRFCRKLTYLKLVEGVTSIGQEAFYGCSGLTSLTIPDSATAIGEDAFSSLNSLKHLTLPGELDTRDRLSYHNTLESVTFTGSRIMSPPVDAYKDGTIEVQFLPGRDARTVIISDSVTAINDYAFYCSFDVQTVTLGRNVQIIGASSFENCPYLTSLQLPQGLHSIGKRAFYYCHALTDLNLPDSLTSLGRDCFYGCDSLQLLTLNNIPDEIVAKTLSLTGKVTVPDVLITATGGKTSLRWDLWTADGYEDSWNYASVYEINGNWCLESLAVGEAVLSCYDSYTGARGSKQIRIGTGIEIRGKTDYLVSGQSVTLSAFRLPANIQQKVTWRLAGDSAKYATISVSSGKTVKLTAKKVTAATQIRLTATPADGINPGTLDLWILPKATGVQILSEGQTLGQTGKKVRTLTVDMHGDPTLALSAQMLPGDALAKVTWKSGNKAVATVDKEGRVTMKKPGTVTITATAADGSKKAASVKLKVTYMGASKLPVPSLKNTTLILNRTFEEPVAVTGVTVGKTGLTPENITFTSTATKKAVKREAAKIQLSYAKGQITASIPKGGAIPKNGTYSFRYKVTLPDGVTLAAKTLTVKVVNTANVGVTLTQTGALDVLDASKSLTLSVKNLVNATGPAKFLAMEGTHKDLFHFEALNDSSIRISLKKDVSYTVGASYSVKLVYQVYGREVRVSRSLKVTQSSLRFTVSGTPVYSKKAPAVLTAQLQLTNPDLTGTRIAGVSVSTKTPLALRQAIGGSADLQVSADGTAISVTLDIQKPGKLTAGKSYTLWLTVKPVTDDLKVTSTAVKVTVKVKR